MCERDAPPRVHSAYYAITHVVAARLITLTARTLFVSADFDRNMAYIMEQLGEDVQADCFYPDAPAKAFLEKVASGEEPPLTAPKPEAEATVA